MECVFFLFPGGVLVVFLCVTGIRTDKEPTGQNPLSVLEPCAVILNFVCRCQYFFKDFFTCRSAGLSLPLSPILIGTVPQLFARRAYRLPGGFPNPQHNRLGQA